MLIAVILVVVIIGAVWILDFIFTDTKQLGLADSVDLSPDDRQIIFSYYNNGVASLYTANIDGTNVKFLTGMKRTSLLRPKYSPDGKKIVFLACPKKKEDRQKSLFVMNRDGRNQKQLTPKNSLVTEVVFSPDSHTIYFLKAGSFKNYSPIASKRPHDYDIFSVDVDGNNMKRLTCEEEYDMSSLLVTSDGQKLLYTNLLYNINDGTGERPLYVVSADGKKEFFKILPKGSLGEPWVYHAALSSDNQSIAFSTVSDSSKDTLFEYELFIMNLKTYEAKQLTKLRSHVSGPVFFHKQNRIMFLQQYNWPDNTPEYQIYTIDLETNNLKRINLVIN